LAQYKSLKDNQELLFETKRLQRLISKRNNKINDLFHKSSRKIIDYCVKHNFGTMVVGYNKIWKRNTKMGEVNNQNFVQLPYFKLINLMRYKSQLISIEVVLETER
jgi:putative transposase